MKDLYKKLLLLAVLVMGLHAAYSLWINPAGMDEAVGESNSERIINSVTALQGAGTNVLFFGDSVNFCFAPQDEDKGSIASFVGILVPEVNLSVFDGRAFHLGVFNAYCRFLAKQAVRPDVILVPVNLRSFSTHWIEQPGWQFKDLQRYLRRNDAWLRLLMRPGRAFQLLKDSDKTWPEFMSEPVYNGKIEVGVVSNYLGSQYDEPDREKTIRKIEFYYMQQVVAENSRLHDLDSLASWGEAQSAPIVFYVSPVDWQACDGILGEEFSLQIRRNVQQIKECLQTHGYPVLDLSEALLSDSFYYRSPYPDEHLNEKGRREVARRLAMALRDKLSQTSKGD